MAVTRDVLVRATPFLWELSERSKTYCNRMRAKLQYVFSYLLKFVNIPNQAPTVPVICRYLRKKSVNLHKSPVCSRLLTNTPAAPP